MSRTVTTMGEQPVFVWTCDAHTCTESTPDPLMAGWTSVISRGGLGEPPTVRDYCTTPCMLLDYAWRALATLYQGLEVPATMGEIANRPLTYLIWSNVHGGWWRPWRMGYTSDIAEAGRFSRQDALGIVGRAAPAGQLGAACVMVAAPESWRPPDDVDDGQGANEEGTT